VAKELPKIKELSKIKALGLAEHYREEITANISRRGSGDSR
jgi:hypothetical protein